MTWDRFRIGASCCLVLANFGCAEDCGEGQARVGAECVTSYTARSVRLNGVGFTPDAVKRATIAGGNGRFEVRRGREVVHRGEAEAIQATDTQEGTLFLADFSDVRDTGEYVVVAEGAGESAKFSIAPDVYVGVVQNLMLGLYGQRCGQEVDFEYAGQHFHHGECHADDAWLDEVGDATQKKPTLYGWHDAGDYGKYVNNGAFSLGMMLLAWQQFPALARVELEIPERGGALPDFLDECKFQLDWLLAMQFEDGSVSDRVTTASFDAPVTPSQSTNRRRLAPATTTATADFVAVVARAARAFEPYDPELAASYRAAAQRGWDYLAATPNDTTPPQGSPIRSRFTGGYWSSDVDDRIWAAAEMWETTGDASILEQFESSAETAQLALFWDWPNMTNLGLYTYLLSQREERNGELVATIRDKVVAQAKLVHDYADAHPYGNPLNYQYIWGSNGIAARTTMSVAVAGSVDSSNPETVTSAKKTIVLTMDHLLGRNYYGRSYVTGLGYYPPRAPHHRPSQADTARDPWPGLLIGGPEGMATSWQDAEGDYRTNEVAINWNAAMIYAAASLLPSE